MMDVESMLPEDDFQREDRCLRAIKTLRRAVLMRFVVLVLVVWAFTRVELSGWMVGLMLFIVVMDLAAVPLLLKELKARKAELASLEDAHQE